MFLITLEIAHKTVIFKPEIEFHNGNKGKEPTPKVAGAM